MNGILNINKHEGPTSFNIVAAVKRITGTKKVGHAGTLDPLASGVLPICLGRATRVSEYMMDYPKKYRAEVEFGKTTDTYDREGEITSESDPAGIDIEQLTAALDSFRGNIRQVPPAYSALKFQGKPYYELARAGKELDIKSRTVTVYDIEVTGWIPPVVTLDITCGKGTYIRSIAHDLGQQCGYGAYMKSLVRLECGPFPIEESISIEELEKLVKDDRLQDYLYPIDHVLRHFPSIIVDETTGQQISHGHAFAEESVLEIREPDIVPRSGKRNDSFHRVYTNEETFLGLFHFDEELQLWKPDKIFL